MPRFFREQWGSGNDDFVRRIRCSAQIMLPGGVSSKETPMAKQSRRRRNAAPKRAVRRPQDPNRKQAESAPAERTVAALHEAAATNPFEPMERFMQAFMPFAWLRPWMTMPPIPKLDVIDRNGSVLVRAEVPGVRKSHLEVEASDMTVTIKGEVQHDEMREDADHYRIAETSRGTFERTVRLPTDVDSTKAKATFKDGVLEVLLPKVDRSRSHHVKL
jgi:HSP20 family protein